MDKRTVKTEKIIKDAFFKFLKTKSAEKITVTEICREADINRSTFYDHYEDMPNFIKSIEDDVVTQCLQILNLYHYDKDTQYLLGSFFSAIKENKNLFSLMFQTPYSNCWNKYKEESKKLARPVWLKESNLSEPEVDFLLEYMLGGTYGVMNQWIESDFEMDMKTISWLYDNAVKYGVYHFIYTK